MPIDKFGRHMLRAEPYPTFRFDIETTPFYICEPSKFYSPCLITIRGEKSTVQSMGFYELENNSLAYTMPVSGIIKSINIDPQVKIFINNESSESASLVDKSVKKGDQLSFTVTSKPKFYVEIVVGCSLIKKDGEL